MSKLTPALNSILTTSMCPWQDAVKSGVNPVLVLWSLSAPDSSRNLATSNLPFWQANAKAVNPVLSSPLFVSAPASSTSSTTSRWPQQAATASGVRPCEQLGSWQL
eukprot:CAMPEP_0181397590 /NCGR_PEP_ID=MMETSP1110-20121109/569_1 /TAXON_ID=174948 /ORGANISM="Symbiodinium sp., Strain CCMP421" /LENGTH=105 /DNA_ID=CAMNT_0023519445 /DNA_START=289 /DNA_END=606 /DNA_ORIENTATION=+